MNDSRNGEVGYKYVEFLLSWEVYCEKWGITGMANSPVNVSLAATEGINNTFLGAE